MNNLHKAILAVVVGTATPLLALAQPGPSGSHCMQQGDRPCMRSVNDDDGTGARIYGHQLMTPEEIAAHRARMQAASPQERARLRAEHHRLMVERARERGITLPAEPPRHGGRQGPGMRQSGADKNRPRGGN